MNMKNFRLNKLALPVFFLVYSLVLLFIARQNVIWEDELYSLDTTSGSFLRALTQSYTFEGQPPFYFMVLNIWRFVSDSVWWARILSIAFTLGAGVYFHLLLKYLIPGKYQLIFTILFLINPFVVWHATEVRLYSMMLFLSSASMYYYIKVFYYQSRRKSALHIYLMIALFGVFTQYLFTFLIFGQVLALFFLKGFKPVLKLVLFLIPVGILFSLNLFMFSEHLHTHQADTMNWSVMNVAKFFRTIQNYLFALDKAHLGTFINRIVLIIYFVWMVNLVLRYRKISFYHELKRKQIYSIAIIAGVTFVLFVISFVLQGINYYDRYMILILPLIIILFLTTFLFSNTILKILFLMGLAAFYLFANFNVTRSFVKTYDYQELAEHLEESGSDKEVIIAYRNIHALPLKMYYKGDHNIVPAPVPMSYDIDYLSGSLIKDTIQLNTFFDKQLSDYNQFVLISDDKKESYGHNMNQKLLSNYIESHFHLMKDSLFFGRSEVNYLRIRKFSRNQ